jgi:hypothetical protein
MSQALASARKRRAPGAEPPRPQIQNNQPSQQVQPGVPPQQGLTLPQVISLVDKRLVTLETFMNETKSSNFQNIQNQNTNLKQEQPQPQINIPSNITEILDEFNSRHELLADEIGSLKNLVMNLQSYTMDVNKMLLQERIKILSDLTDLGEGNIETESIISNANPSVQIDVSEPTYNIAGSENIQYSYTNYN